MAGRSRKLNPSTKGLTKSIVQKNQVSKPTGSFSIYGYDLAFVVDTATLFDKMTESFISHALAASLAIIIMVQIRLSLKTESQQYVDGLPSFKLYKQRVLSSEPGRAWCVTVAVTEALKFIEDQNVSEIAEAYWINPVLPVSPTGKPNKDNWGKFIPYRMTQVLGTIQSCPASNIKTFGLNPTCETLGFDEALSFIYKNASDQQKQDAVEILKTALLTNKGGIPTNSLTLDESSMAASKVELEIFDGAILRNGQASNSLLKSGTIPPNAITAEMVSKHLDTKERILYRVASNTGDRVSLHKLTQKIIAEELKLANKKSVASVVKDDVVDVPVVSTTTIDPKTDVTPTTATLTGQDENPPKAGRKRAKKANPPQPEVTL